MAHTENVDRELSAGGVSNPGERRMGRMTAPLSSEKFYDFRGRASRPEFWWFYLFFVGALFCAGILDGVLEATLDLPAKFHSYGGFNVLAIALLMVPFLSVSARRLHDMNHSGCWALLYLIPFVGHFVLLVWFCMKGTQGDNRFGAAPLV